MSIARLPRSAVKLGAMAAAIACGVALSGCSTQLISSQTFSSAPTELGGLSPDAPARSAEPIAYPAVHDMPPARRNAVLTPDEQRKVEAELAALRERQTKRAGTAPKDD
jgi:hypothetical protein